MGPQSAVLRSAGLLEYNAEEVGTVAVLTPYKAQVGVLRSTFFSRCSEEALDRVYFATIDGFQVCRGFASSYLDTLQTHEHNIRKPQSYND